jgi:hypothetical protein
VKIHASLELPHYIVLSTWKQRRMENNSLRGHQQPDWSRLLGQHVEIRQDGRLLRTGTVDAVMPDNSILWLSAEGPWPREMVERWDGRVVFARYEWDVSADAL